MTTPSFDDLYHAQCEPTLALCLHLTGSRTLAEEAFQETFLLVHENLARFRGESRASTWVYTIAVRTAARVRERERAQAARARKAALASPSPDPGPSPGKADHQALHDALARLPDDDRALLALLALRELTSERVAEILGIPLGTVYSRSFAARKELRRLMGATPAHGAPR